MRVAVDDLLFEKVIRSDQKFSAMQKATAFPIAAAAHTAASYDFSQPVLKYDDLGVTPFNTWLDVLFLHTY
jgi:saccharopine dehydrogenase-like NADP-dependent oxidoreductase